MANKGRWGAIGQEPALLVTLAIVSCSSTLAERERVVDVSSQVLVCSQTEHGMTDLGLPSVERETYLQEDLNRLLTDYPDFAAVAGVRSVTDCASARRIVAAYWPYRERHPEFDPIPEDDHYLPPLGDPIVLPPVPDVKVPPEHRGGVDPPRAADGPPFNRDSSNRNEPLSRPHQ